MVLFNLHSATYWLMHQGLCACKIMKNLEYYQEQRVNLGKWKFHSDFTGRVMRFVFTLFETRYHYPIRVSG